VSSPLFIPTFPPYRPLWGGKRRKTAAELFDTAEANGLTTLDRSGIDDNQVFRPLKLYTERKYKVIINFWDEYAAPRRPALPVAFGHRYTDLDPALAT
jgi:hypothetical protein